MQLEVLEKYVVKGLVRGWMAGHQSQVQWRDFLFAELPE
jgi:hypothetical protein